MPFKIDKFKVIPETKLSEAEFDYFPVWSEHYDWEEIEELERWGLDKDKVLESFSTNQQGNLHCLYTCLQCDPLPNRMRIYIKAKLKTQNGIELKGYILNENAFNLCVFLEGKKYCFSRYLMLSDMMNKQLTRLSAALGVESENVFPISYETDFFDKAGNKILGIFDNTRNCNSY